MPGEGSRAGHKALRASNLLRELGRLRIKTPLSFSQALGEEGPSSVENV